MNLEDKLASLRQMGRLDSQGSFSIDSDRADLLLEKFRLPAPQYFMLHAVGAAVCSGATRVEVTLRSNRFEVTFDGRALEPVDAEQCFASLWSPERTPDVMRLRELAIARTGAGTASFIQETLPDGRQRLRVEKAGLRARLARLLGSAGRLEDEQLLRAHLVSTSSCQIRINGRAALPLTPPSDVLQAFIVGGADDLIPAVVRGNFRQLTAQESDPELLAGARGLVCRLLPSDSSPAQAGRKERSYWPGFLDLVLNGRLYRCQLPAAWPPCWGTLALGTLHRDLSHTFINAADLERLFALIGRELL